MKRMTKTPDTADSANAARTAQARFTSRSREIERANGIDDSPAMVAQRKKLDSLFGGAIQRVEEEEPLQGKFEGVQRVEKEEPLQGKFATTQRVEEEEPLQGKFETAQRVEEEEPLQGKFETVQRVEEEEPLQGKFEMVQRVEEEEPLQGKFEAASSVQFKEETAKPNNTGLPDNLKSGIESLSGMSMDNVRVHYNSSQPAQLNALAYAQGSDIHVAPGQEQHLPHEAWHVVQQAQGRVKPTMQMKEGVPVNDDKSLEREADVMGAKALSMEQSAPQSGVEVASGVGTLQRQEAIDNRQAQIDELQNALNGIPDDGQMATPDEIELHDNAIHAGQHHRNRVVRRRDLRADLQGRIDVLQGYQNRDNLRLPNLHGRQAAQLQG